MNQLNKWLFLSAISVGLLIQQPKTLAETKTIETAQELYQQSRYPEAVELLEITIEQAIADRDSITSIIALRNLALIHQKLGQWQQAKTTLSQAEKTLATLDDQGTKSQLLAQILEVKGQIQLSLGRSSIALETWKQAGNLYQQQDNIKGYTQVTIYQAFALQSLGLYSQSIKTLTPVNQRLSDQPNTAVKAQALLSIGNVLTRVGEYQQAAVALNTSLTVAQELNAELLVGEILLSLGNHAKLQSKPQTAIKFYQRAIALADQDLQLRARLERLDILIGLSNISKAVKTAQKIEQLLDSLPPNQTTVQGRVSLARYSMELNTKLSQRSISSEPIYAITVEGISLLLVDGVQQARKLNLQRIEADALGTLGSLYEQNQQFAEAEQITQRALFIAQSINATELTYQWQWQLGRILIAQGQTQSAIAAYTQATNNLQSLRSDLVAVSSNIQYSFREKIEPVYRELAALLLHPQASQADLNQGRQIIESLQVAELDNFFQEACLDLETQSIESIDPKAAVIYSLILPDRLGVILSQPGQPLKYHQTAIANPQEVVRTFEDLYANLNPFLAVDRPLQPNQTLYNWLIRPFKKQLQTNDTNTVVFVLDGIMRGVPLAALHDGKQYLIEQYSLAITPGLQLLTSSSLDFDSLKTIAGGITESHQGFTSLPNVKTEVEQIASLVPSEILLDQDLTRDRLQAEIASSSYPIVHLATHGQFSNRAEDTFLLIWNDRINVKNLDGLLQNRNFTQDTPIELLILSACQTAAGDNQAALGLAGIAIRSGARSTVATLWSIQDDSTAKLIAEFYQALKTPGISKAEALRQAQLSLLRSPKYEHPFYWSAFILLGNWL